jgi:hypothetical protein
MYLEGNSDFKVIFTNPTTGIVVEVDEKFKDIYFVGEVRTTFNNIEQPNSNFYQSVGSVEYYFNMLKEYKKKYQDSVNAINKLIGE